MRPCLHCGRLVSLRCNGGIHRTCLAAHITRPSQLGAHEAQDINHQEELPSFDSICAADIETRDTIGAGLFEKASKEFLKCVDAVLQHSRPDAWDHVGTDRDSIHHRRARTAWTELWMFPKTCMAVLPGGKVKEKRNINVLANRLDRWSAGERAALWQETVARQPRRSRQSREESEEKALERRQDVALSLARRGLPGQAVKRLHGPGVARDTREVAEAMR